MDQQEFARRVRDMGDFLFRVCCSQLSNESDREDAVQECVYKAWRSRNQLKEERYFRTWMTRILINTCHDIRQKSGRTLSIEELGPTQLAAVSTTPDEDIPPQAAALRVALSQLDEGQRLPLILHHLGGFSTEEIARILQLRPGAVRTRMTRARARLKELLQEEAGGDPLIVETGGN
jgi:RNA polymerase sigma-70 factor (ECF subfamily)